jgi:hypothetical protein
MNRKSLLIAGGGAILLAALLLPGQDGRQEWELSRYNGNSVRFTIERWKPGQHHRSTSDVPVERFRGLTAAFERRGAVKFEYVQDAGRLICQGNISSFGRGAGTFTFAPDPDFTAELKRLGYSAPTDNQLFDMMLMGVNLDEARTAKETGLNASLGDLLDMRVHGVNADFMRDTHRAGYRNLAARDLVQMKIHGVSSEFLQDLKAAGYEIPTKQVVDLRIHGVSSQFLRDLKDYDLHPSAPDMVQLKIHGVGADFMRDAKALGYNFTAQELVNLRIHGVDGRYLRRLHDSGMKNLTADKIQKLKIHGID